MATSAISPASQIGIEDFLRILVAQLNYQDPLKPMDNTEFVTQLAQFTSLQQTQDTNAKIADLLSVQATTQSIGLLGKTVDVNSDGTAQSGVVQAVNFNNGEPRMTVRLSSGAFLTDISLSAITSVR